MTTSMGKSSKRPLHLLCVSSTDGLDQRLLTPSSWHRDVKPANILVCGTVTDSHWDVEFLLSDLGLARFTSTESQHGGKEKVDKGIHTYGRP